MCMKNVLKEAKEFAKPITASSVPFVMLEIPTLPQSNVSFFLDYLKIMASIAGIIYTLFKTYYLIKNKGKK